MLPSLLLFTKSSRETVAATATATAAMIPLGLKNLADTNLNAPSNCVTRNNILAVRSSTPPSPAEECVINDAPEAEAEEEVEEHEEDEEGEEYEEDTCWAAYGRRGRVGGRGLPPPIPRRRLLQRTYAGDGRLVIREVASRRHVYFRARRRGGRLTLRPLEYVASACALKRENDRTGLGSSQPLDLFVGEDQTVEVRSGLFGEGCFGVSERSNPLMQTPMSSFPTVRG